MTEKRTIPEIRKRIKNERLPLYRLIWCRIRYYQQLHEIGDQELANALGVHIRTLKEYDKTAENVTFGRLDRFLYVNGLSLNDLMNS